MASGIASDNWTTPIELLSVSDRVSAIIDSSTPYLWFPQDVCDVFAEKLKLTYNASLNLYTFDADPLQHEELQNAQLTFSVSLSDLATSPGLVNITLPYDAFDLQLTFPAIPNTTYGSEDSSKFYFPLRRATNEAQYRIGRVFLQEAYLITDYERNSFSVHQAIHTSDPISDLNITAIPRASSTTFSKPPSSSRNLSTGAIVGIVLGVLAIVALVAVMIFWVCHRRKAKAEGIDEKAESSSGPRNMFSRLLRRGRPPLVHETNGSETYAAEVGADATHERFELPAPLGPVELDSESGTLTGRASSENTENLSAYEIARRKLERQQARATAEKTEVDVSQIAHYRAPESEYDSALISPLGPDSENSLSFEQPSPMTPGFPSQEIFPPPTYRRINPANVVYAGRLPDNVQLPQNIPKVVGRDGRTIRSEPSDPPVSPREVENSTLGSQYTIDELNNLYDSNTGGHQADVSPVSNESGSNGYRIGAREPRDDARLGEMLHSTGPGQMGGDDLVHIPQPAEHRFSWEEERVSGLDNTI